ncbi:peptidoglycan-binding protein [Parafrankia sp. FMc6]|uniref:peptidoglycan-binding protein n=1 Tax=Parafrankia soli TaxID=2599596 RepID=UPI0034D66A89
MHPAIQNYWITFNEPLEGRVNFMYLDQKGWVSTGVGNKIDETVAANSAPTPAERAASLALAGELGWLDSGGSPAAPEQIAADWDAVKSRLDLAPQGHRAFRSLTALNLDDKEIDRFVFVKLDQMEIVLVGRQDFTDFASWPANAQLATLSMCWALGPAFRFPKLQRHVSARDWSGAAAECHFEPDLGTIRIRNMLDRAHFLLARAAEDQGLPAEQLALDVSDEFGVQGALLALGYGPGPQDGVAGPTTQRAVRAFQSDNVLASQNGAWDDPETRGALGARLMERGFAVFGG